MDWKEKLAQASGIDINEVNMQSSDNQSSNEVDNSKQTLCTSYQKRNGKPATIIEGFEGSDAALKDLAKQLKNQLGVGGSVRDGEILIQGDFRNKLKEILKAKGFNVKGV